MQQPVDPYSGVPAQVPVTTQPVPDPAASMLHQGVVVVGTGVAILVGIFVLVWFVRRFLHICRPNEILIFSGKRGEGELNYRVFDAGRAIRFPVIEQVDRMDMTAMTVDLMVNNAFSKGNILMQIQAVAVMKIASDPQYRGNAIERFLGKSPMEIRDVAQRTLEGALREVIATMTPEEVNEDRLKFAGRIIENAVPDLHKLGMQLDMLKIQNVSDDAHYLDSIGRGRIAEVLRDAEMAESQAERETQEAQANARRRAEQGRANAQAEVEVKQNEVRRAEADLDGTAQATELEAEAAAHTARWEAERELQTVRVELEKQRLEADEIIRAEAEKTAATLIAKADAAPALEQGLATSEVLRLLSEAYAAAGPHAKEVFVIQQLDRIVETVVKSVRGVRVDTVNMLDPGDGSALPAYVAAYPQTVAAVLATLRQTIGVDVGAVLGVSGSSGSNGRGT